MSRLVVQPLIWDSAFLGYPVARLTAQHLSAASLTALIDQSRVAGIRLVYLVADPADAETAAVAQQVGVWLADRKVTFARKTNEVLTGAATGPDSVPIVNVTACTPQLERLAWQSGTFSRFRRDKNFAPQVFPNLYSHWLHASLNGELARVVLACSASPGAELGFLTLGERDGCASIGLLAVDGPARGRGVGRRLVEAARQQALRWNCTRLQVTTQRDNGPACRFYSRCGFEMVREEHIYHLWP